MSVELTPEQLTSWFWHAWPTCFAYACFMAGQFGDEFNRFKHRKAYDPHWFDMYFWDWLEKNQVPYA